MDDDEGYFLCGNAGPSFLTAKIYIKWEKMKKRKSKMAKVALEIKS